MNAAVLTLIAFALLVSACSLFAVVPSTTQSTRPAASIRVMSFNIRYGAANDGEDRWENRRAHVLETIEAYVPDLLGTQEVLASQAAYLREKLPGYDFVGVGREDGVAKGEFAAIFFRSDRFDLIDSGHYWLSETPTKVASVGWDADLTRMMTWAKLKERGADRTLLFVNTHWDHKGVRARLESAKLMRRLIDELGGGAMPTIVTGDFNCTEVDPPYAALVDEALVDTYRAAHPEPKADEASFHGFKGTREGKRIDWILASRDFKTREAAIVRTAKDGRFPSDHYPVTATVELMTP